MRVFKFLYFLFFSVPVSLIVYVSMELFYFIVSVYLQVYDMSKRRKGW